MRACRANRRVNVLAGGILVLLVYAAPNAARTEEVRVSCRHDEIFTSSGAPLSVVYLSHRPVVASSEVVRVDGTPLARGEAYSMDYAQGIVYLAQETVLGSVVRVNYLVFPLTLKPSYQLRTVEECEARPTENLKPQVPLRNKKPSYDLRASGSKTISIEAGSLTDFRVSQALSLSLGGKIGEGVEVRGVLSDKDMSLGERTSTTKLQDLDRVFLEVRSPRAYARVGDFEINEAPGELLSFKRNLTGFLGDASHGPERLLISGAQSRSRYETTEIIGREGVSGPYRIGGSEGEDIGLVTNSDKVWLDGEAMKRGRNADYVVDYEAGEIYFNPKRLIREGARIVIDYESERDSDRRQFYFARSNLGIGERANIAVSFLKEGTDPVTPNENLDPLASAEPSAAPSSDGWMEGAKFVGLGNGDYIRVKQDTLVYYEFAGERGGDYDVTFTLVGDGKGTYSFVLSDRWGREVHVYTGEGAYVDRVQALQKITSQVLHLSASAKPAQGLEVTSEFAQSRGHKQSDDGLWDFREDRAYAVGLKGSSNLPEVAGHSTGTVDIGAKRRWIGQNYLALGRLRSPGILERWAQDPGDGFEATNEMSLTYRMGTNVRTSAELGSMAAEGGESSRDKFTVDLGNARLGLTATSETARLNSDSRSQGVRRTGIGFRAPLKFVDFQVGRTSDLRTRLTDDTSLMRIEYYSLAKLAGMGSAVALSLARSSEDKDRGFGWEAYSSSLDSKLEFETEQGRRLALRGQVAHRRITYLETGDLGERRMTSADIGLNLRDVLALSSAALNYSLANTLTSLYATRLVRVGVGGDYDSLGHYRPGTGGYEITRYESGKQPVTRMRANVTLETGLKGKILLERTLSSRTTFEIEGESSKAKIGKLAVPNPGYIFRPGEVVFGRVDVGEEMVVNRFKGVTFAASAKATRSIEARCTGRTEKGMTTQFQTRLSSSNLRKTSAGLAWRIATTRKAIEIGETQIKPSSRTWVASATLERMISESFRGRMALEVLSEDKSEPHSNIMQGSLSPGFTVFWGALRCDTGVSVRRLLRSESSSQMFLISRDSVDWNSRINLRQGKYTSLACEYVGRKARGLPTIHNVRASLSATF